MKNELTLEDLDLLIEALDNLPNKGMMGEMMGELLVAMVSKDSDGSQRSLDQAEKLRIEKEARKRTEEEKRRVLTENAAVLKSKLILMKRDLG